MPEPCYWRLVYDDGWRCDEGDEAVSILLQRPFARRLVACRGPLSNRREMVQIDLREAGHRWVPVFYRRRGTTMDGRGIVELEATVFGRARSHIDGRVVSALWALVGDLAPANVRSFVSCPARFYDQAAVELAVAGG